MKDLKEIQLEYHQQPLQQKDLSSKPWDQLENWFTDLEKENITYPNAAILGSVDSSGWPSSRTILVKGFSKEGILFFTDYESQKGKDIASNPKVSLTFFWKELDRQVRIQGMAEKTSFDESETYFQSRPLASQISAASSFQSNPVTKEELENRVKAYSERYQEKVPCPERWGGYRISFERVEFWQGRPNRLHDRYLYTKDNDTWNIQRLSP